jgi:hypothetical protein
MHVHDMAGKSAGYYPHLKDAFFMAYGLHEENSRALPTV